MNVNPIIEKSLESLNLPVDPNVNLNDDNEYITFNYVDERPVLRADDTDLYDETTVQVHYFTRGNPQPNKKAIRRLLKASGFTIISTSEFYESDTKFHHIVVEAWIDGVIND